HQRTSWSDLKSFAVNLTDTDGAVAPFAEFFASAIFDNFFQHRLQLGGGERQAADLVVGDHIDQVATADDVGELAQVHLPDDHLRVPLENLAEVARQRVEVAQVGLGDGEPALPQRPGRRADRPVRRAPAEHQHRGVAVGVVEHQVGYLDRLDPGRPGTHHEVV